MALTGAARCGEWTLNFIHFPKLSRLGVADLEFWTYGRERVGFGKVFLHAFARSYAAVTGGSFSKNSTLRAAMPRTEAVRMLESECGHAFCDQSLFNLSFHMVP